MRVSKSIVVAMAAALVLVSKSMSQGGGSSLPLSHRWWVDAANGSDTGLGTLGSPYKSITQALKVVNDYDVVLIAPGTYSNKPKAQGGTEEVFPLTTPTATPKRAITLAASGTTKPIIQAFYDDGFGGYVSTSFVGAPQMACDLNPARPIAACIFAGDDWTLRRLRISNDKFDKVQGTPSPPDKRNEVIAVYVENLGLASLSIPQAPSPTRLTLLDCEISDNFWGLWVRDCDSALQLVAREVIVQDCEVDSHWPVGVVQPGSQLDPTDRGHAGIESNTYPSLDMQITASTIRNNHDGLESGNNPLAEGLITVVASTIADNENGIEFGDSDIIALDSTFRTNGVRDYVDGGGGPANCSLYGTKASPGIGMRGTTANATPSIFVRRCKFDRNQIGVRIKDSGSSLVTWDLGDVGNLGHNCFLTDTQSPWIAGPSFGGPPPPAVNRYWNVPFCAIVTEDASQVKAIGNVWTYLPGGGTDNQLACSAGATTECAGLAGSFGDYECSSAPSVLSSAGSFDLNYYQGYSTGIPGPLPRPMEISGAPPGHMPPSDPNLLYDALLNPNNPWNVSIGDHGTVHPSIRVK